MMMNNMEAKHTPGPWNPIKSPDDCGGGWWIQGPEINECRDLTILSPNFSTEANARLIAAAPDLLAAAESALAFLEQLGYHGGGNTPAANLMRAITKAKGE
jgi:hypothetical protein